MKKVSKEDAKIITELVNIYFKHNTKFKGFGYKIKTWDTIHDYLILKKKSYKDIKECIELNTKSLKPIWELLNNYFYKNIKIDPLKGYKDTINDSTNIDDWI